MRSSHHSRSVLPLSRMSRAQINEKTCCRDHKSSAKYTPFIGTRVCWLQQLDRSISGVATATLGRFWQYDSTSKQGAPSQL